MPRGRVRARCIARTVTAVARIGRSGQGPNRREDGSYLRAAYATAMRAEGDATAPAAMIAYGVGANPVADTESLSAFTKARDRTLTDEELYTYWRRLAKVKGDAVGGALQLALLLGGQNRAIAAAYAFRCRPIGCNPDSSRPEGQAFTTARARAAHYGGGNDSPATVGRSCCRARQRLDIYVRWGEAALP